MTGWIRARKEEYSALRAVIVSIPSDVKATYDRTGRLQVAFGVRNKLVAEGFVTPDSLAFYEKPWQWTSSVAVGRDGPLRELFQLAKDLAQDCLWKEGQATMFVLTGAAPLYPSARIQLPASRTEIREDETSRSLTGLARIVLNLDPYLTPREVADIYRTERATLAKKKLRQMSEKHLLLAEFTAGKSIDESLMSEWNRRHPSFAYRRYALFHRDAQRSQERLLHITGMPPHAPQNSFP